VTDAKRWFDAALADTSTKLSPAGQHRRQAMGAELRRAIAHRRQRRRARRAALGIALLLALVWLGSGLGSPPRRDPQQVVENPPPSLQHMDFVEVRNQGDVLARYCTPLAPPQPALLIDDEELLRLLVAANRPTGLIRTADRVFLTAKVTDDLPLAEDG
jgi:hypothetical protein